MRTSLLLLKIIGKAALHLSGVGGIWTLLVEEGPELANNVYSDWSAARSRVEQPGDLEEVAVLGDNVAIEVKKVVDEIAADQPESVRQELTEVLTQMPSAFRQAMRSPADSTGQTVPPGLEPKSGQDLIPFLATKRPRFNKGEHPMPGSDWVLDDFLGSGGFGEVWKATHSRFDNVKPVALKFCIDPLARDRLLTHEAKICAQVQEEGKHPGIVELKHTYLNADPPFLEYEYINGGTLTNVIKDIAGRERLPSPEKIAKLMMAIARPVAFAHRLRNCPRSIGTPLA